MNTQQEKDGTGAGKKSTSSRKPATDGHDMLMSFESIVGIQDIGYAQKVELIKTGVTKEQLIRLKEIFELDYDLLSELLVVTNRSLHLKKGKDVLNRNVSDRVVAIADVFSLGYNVFGDRAMFHRWLRNPSEDLDGAVPLELLGTIVGIEEVKKQLRRRDSFVK